MDPKSIFQSRLNDGSVVIAVIGLGYVGLPLAAEFGKHFNTIGFDINATRIQQLRNGVDHTRETSAQELADSTRLSFSTEIKALDKCTVFIVTVPTPVEVLEAAGTKWNFLPFRPGLVGGHCISVDPYYLTHKAQAVGHHPDVILAGRRTNDGMGRYVASKERGDRNCSSPRESGESTP